MTGEVDDLEGKINGNMRKEKRWLLKARRKEWARRPIGKAS